MNFIAVAWQLGERDHLHRAIGGTPLFSLVLVALVGERPHEDLAAHVPPGDPEHGADDEDVDPEPAADELGRLAIDPAVDVDLGTVRLVLEVVARREQLVRGDVAHELLAAEPGFDGRDEDDVERGPVRIEGAERRPRLDREAGGAALGVDLLDRRRDLLRRDLDVERAESQPASRNSSMYFSGWLIIRCASSGSSVRFRMLAIIFGPNVRFGQSGRP